MRNFMKLADGVPVQPILFALARQPGLWDQHTLRTQHPATPHRQVSDIWLRFADLTPYQQPEATRGVVDEHESVWYEAAAALPEVRPHLFALMALVQGERLGRVLITRLSPGCRIAPHVDGGSHAAYYERFHLSLQCAPEALFRCGDEVVWMQPGELWWFQNSLEHEVWNESTQDRLTLIMDVKCSTVGGLPCTP